MKKIVIALIILGLLYCIAVIMGWGLVHEVGKNLFDIMPVFTPLIIGAGIIYIAWQQWQTNKNILVMGYYDRGFKVYEAMVELITTEIITTDEMQKYKIKIAHARYVFKDKKDIHITLEEVKKIGNKIAIIMEEYPSVCTVKELDELLSYETRLSDLYINLYKAGEEGTAIFEKYLTLKV